MEDQLEWEQIGSNKYFFFRYNEVQRNSGTNLLINLYEWNINYLSPFWRTRSAIVRSLWIETNIKKTWLDTEPE